MVWVAVFNATCNNISWSVTCILWWSFFFVEETGVPRENHQPVASHRRTLSHNVVSSTLHHEQGFELATLVVIGTDCRDSENPTTIRSRPRWPTLIYKKVGENWLRKNTAKIIHNTLIQILNIMQIERRLLCNLHKINF
jgi:hypothetical protein